MSCLINMVPPVDQMKVVGSTVHSKSINILAEDECNRIYGSHKKLNMVEEFVVNVDQQITKQRRNRFYFIADYKNTYGSFKRARLHIKSVFSGPVLVPVPVNLPDNAPVLKATTTTIFPFNHSTSVPDNHSTPVDPAHVPTTTNVPVNRPRTVSPGPDPTITTTKTTTTCVYTNNNTQNAPVIDLNPPPQNSPVYDMTPSPNNVAPVPDTSSTNTSTPMVVADCYGVKWYDYEDVIGLY